VKATSLSMEMLSERVISSEGAMRAIHGKSNQS
jgi:hypothetical protein